MTKAYGHESRLIETLFSRYDGEVPTAQALGILSLIDTCIDSHPDYFYHHHNSLVYAVELQRILSSFPCHVRPFARDDRCRKNWSFFNPSAVVDDQGRTWESVRSSNYTALNSGYFSMDSIDGRHSPTPVFTHTQGKFATDTFIYCQGKPVVILRAPTLSDPPESGCPHLIVDIADRDHTYLVGMEDVRLQCRDSDIWVSGMITDRIAERHVHHFNVSKALRNRLDSIALPRSTRLSLARVDRNIVPIQTGGYVYQWDPYVELDNLGNVAFVGLPSSGHLLKHFRGGSQIVAHPSRPSVFYAVVHQLHQIHAHRRLYLHRLVKIDRGVGIVAISYPFWFNFTGCKQPAQIEYVSGLTMLPDRLSLWVGHDDQNAYRVDVEGPIDSIVERLMTDWSPRYLPQPCSPLSSFRCQFSDQVLPIKSRHVV